MRGAVAAERDEGDVVPAGALDAATADDAPAVGEQHHLEQHGRRVGAGAGEVVLVAGVETVEVKFVIDKVVQGVFEGAGQQLPLQINGNEARAGVDVFVAGHGRLSKRDPPMTLDIPDGSQQNAGMEELFLRPR